MTLPNPPPLLVALTGGIASGKSSVASILRARGLATVDTDVLGHEVLHSPSPAVLRGIIQQFGPSVLDGDGSILRSLLAERVFSSQRLRRELEAIVHPAIEESLVACCREKFVEGHDLIVVEVPLLFEVGWQGRFHRVVVVDCPEDIQKIRLERLRRTNSEDAVARIQAQTSRQRRLEGADYVLHNDGDPAHLEEQVDRLVRELMRLVRGGGEKGSGGRGGRSPGISVVASEARPADCCRTGVGTSNGRDEVPAVEQDISRGENDG